LPLANIGMYWVASANPPDKKHALFRGGGRGAWLRTWLLKKRECPFTSFWRKGPGGSCRPPSSLFGLFRCAFCMALRSLQGPVCFFDLCVAPPSEWKRWRGVSKRRHSIVIKNMFHTSLNQVYGHSSNFSFRFTSRLGHRSVPNLFKFFDCFRSLVAKCEYRRDTASVLCKHWHVLSGDSWMWVQTWCCDCPLQTLACIEWRELNVSTDMMLQLSLANIGMYWVASANPPEDKIKLFRGGGRGA